MRDITFKDYFCGNKISEYGRKNGRVDYATLVKAFDAVLNNNIIQATGWEYWEQENGYIDNEDEIDEIREQIEELEAEKEAAEESSPEALEDKIEELEAKIDALEDKIEELEEEQIPGEIFQYYIISDNGARILEDYTNEIVFYNSELDMYVWGVTHWGTSWDYVLTDIQCERDETARA